MTSQQVRLNPYVGPRAFQQGERLYGREREIRELLDLLIAERIVLLHSPSGAGKSSLVQAGLLPHLEEEGFRVLPTVRVNLEPPPVLCDLDGFNRYVFSAILSLEEDLPGEETAPQEALACMTLEGYLADRPRGDAAPDTEVVIFDQFEEILTLNATDRDVKMAFFSQIGAALRDRKRWALFSIREDFVAALDPYLRPVPTRLANTYHLDLLGKDAALQAIQGPARDSGVEFQDAAAHKLVDDLRRVRVQRPDGSVEEQLGPFVEPVQLQVVCFRLWDQMPAGAGKISLEDVESIGDVDTALADYYAERVAAAAGQAGVSERLVRDWVENQLITEQGIRGQVLMGQKQSGGLDNHAIRFLEDAHLIRSEKRGGGTWFELAHDRLIDPIRRSNAAWLQANLSLVQRQAALWNSQDRPDSLLLRDQALKEAQEWAEVHPDELSPVDADFLEASREEMDRQQAVEKAKEARRLRRWNRIITLFSLLAVLLAVLAVFFGQRSFQNETLARISEATARAAESTAQADKATAVAAESTARSDEARAESAEATAQADKARAESAEAAAIAEERLAHSGELAALSLNILGQQPDLSFLLSLEALNAADTLQARNALLSGLQSVLSWYTSPVNATPPALSVPIKTLAISADGARLAIGGEFGQVSVWDVPTSRSILTKSTGEQAINSVYLSADGEILITGDDLGNIVYWDVASGIKLKDFNPSGAPVYSLAVSPDGSLLVQAGAGREIILRDAETTDFVKSVFPRGSVADVLSVAWSPDSSHLATGGADAAVRIYDIVSGEVVFESISHEGSVNRVAWSPDGQWLASGGDDHRGEKDVTVILWDLATGEGYPLEGFPGDVAGVAFSPDGKVLAAGGEDGLTVLWDLSTFSKIDQLEDHTDRITSVVFNSVGTPILATAGLDRRSRLYSIAAEQPLGSLFSDGKGLLRSLAIPSFDTVLMLGVLPDAVTIWEADRGSGAAEELYSTNLYPTAAAMDGTGTWFALGFGDSSTRLWRAETDGTYTEAGLLAGGAFYPVDSLAFSPDGDTLAVGLCVDEPSRRLTCERSAIQLWSLSAQERFASLELEQGNLTSLAFSPGGLFLVGGTQDDVMAFWYAEDGRSFDLVDGLQFAQLGGFTSLAFEPSGRLLAGGTGFGGVIMLDFETLSLYGSAFTGGAGAVTALAFSPDGMALASGSQAGTVAFWDLDVDQWRTRACGLAGRNLTPDEWAKYVKDPEYRKTCDQWP
jgi:WD40 repeat protein